MGWKVTIRRLGPEELKSTCTTKPGLMEIAELVTSADAKPAAINATNMVQSRRENRRQRLGRHERWGKSQGSQNTDMATKRTKKAILAIVPREDFSVDEWHRPT